MSAKTAESSTTGPLAPSARRLRVAYLVNQYPKVSHSFIRNEIAAVESDGVTVERYTIRATDEPLVDERDRRERARTRVILDGGVVGLIAALVATAFTRPVAFLRTLGLALGFARRARMHRLHPFAYLAEACVLRHWLAESKAQHLHAHFGTNPAMVALLCRALGGPTFSFTAHGIETFDKSAFLELRAKVRHAQFVVAVSDHGRSQLLRWSSPEHWSRIHVIRCGVDIDFLAAQPAPIPRSPTLVCVGRIDVEKGHVLLIEALTRLARLGRQFTLALIGDGAQRPAIEALVRERRLEGRVRFLGWRSGHEVRREIRAARALVLPSFAEGLPVVLIEALALERPVVATHVGGVAELVVPGVNGWLVPAGSVDGLADALDDALARTPEELEEMGRRGALLVALHHDALANGRALAALFREAVEGTAEGDAIQTTRGADAPARRVA